MTQANKTITLCFLICSCVSQLWSQTTIIPGNVFGTWTKSGSPYKITGNINVPSGQSLMIEKGVSVEFQGKYDLQVYGKISAIGDMSDTIKFYPSDTNNRWKRIWIHRHNSNDSFIFRYCKFSYTNDDNLVFSAALTIDSCLYSEISNCVFEHNRDRVSTAGLSVRNQRLRGVAVVKNCRFYRCEALNINSAYTSGAYTCAAGASGTSIWDSCTFIECRTYNKYNANNSQLNGDIGIMGLAYTKNASVSNCHFISNSTGAMCAGIFIVPYDSSTIKIDKCIFQGNKSKTTCPIFLDASAGFKKYKLTIQNCRFEQNKNIPNQDDYAAAIGATMTERGSLFIENCTFEENEGASIIEIVGASLSTGTINKCYFNKNKGIAVSSSNLGGDLVVSNSLMVNNWGGITTVANGKLTAVGNIIANNGRINGDTRYPGMNGAPYVGGCMNFGGTMYLYNNIVWGNKDSLNNSANFTTSTKNSYWKNNIIEGDSAAIRYITAGGSTKGLMQNVATLNKNPLFVGPTAGAGPGYDGLAADWHGINTCQALSPAYNAGVQVLYSVLGFFDTSDLDNNPRLRQRIIDLGPYEMAYAKSIVKRDTAPVSLTNICPGTEVEFRSTFISGPVSFQWQQSTNGTVWSAISSATLSTLKIPNPKVKTWYRCIATGVDCGVKDTSLSATSTPLPGPTPNLGADASIPYTGSKLLTPGSFNSYLWSTGTNASSLTVNKTNLDTGKNTIWVEVTGSNGCKGRDTVIITLEPSTGSLDLLLSNIKVYPIPLGESLHIDLPVGFSSDLDAKYQLMSTDSRIIKSGQLNGKSEVFVADLLSGTYYLIIDIDGRQYGLTVIK